MSYAKTLRFLFLIMVCMLVTLVGVSAQEEGLTGGFFAPADNEAEITKAAPDGQPLVEVARIPNQYIVIFNEAVGARSAKAATAELAASYDVKTQQEFTTAVQGFSAELSEEQLAALKSDERVAYIEQDSIITLDTTIPAATWGLDRIDQSDLPLDGTYTYDLDGTGVDVYIIDTGILSTHDEFGGRVLGGFSAIPNDASYEDCHGHGTHVAGTAAGATYGIAKNANLYAVRVLGCTGSGSTSGVLAGIDWVTQNASGPSVANMSLGVAAVVQTILDAVDTSIQSGVSYALAAGNSSANACNYSPAAAPNAMTVGATTSLDAQANYSNFGTCLDVYAPGSGVLSAYIGSNSATATLSGTSMAAPHVAGVAALYLEDQPTATPAQVSAEITSNAVSGRVLNLGAGSPNLLLQTSSATVTPPGTDASFYFSFQKNGSVGGVNFRDEDVLFYDSNLDTWEMYFDGSDVGAVKDLVGFTFTLNNEILMTFNQPQTLPGVGLVDDSDIVKFVPTSTGSNTAGTFEMFLDGSTVGLDTNGEDIDAIARTYDGYLLISTAGTAKVESVINPSNTVIARDEDMLVYAPSPYTSGPGGFEIFTDGSNDALNNGADEDIWAAELGIGKIYFSTKGAYDTGTATGTGIDLLLCTPQSATLIIPCTMQTIWTGSTIGLDSNNSIDALYVLEPAQ